MALEYAQKSLEIFQGNDPETFSFKSIDPCFEINMEELPDREIYNEFSYFLKVASILSSFAGSVFCNQVMKKSDFYNLDLYVPSLHLGVQLYFEDTYFELMKKKRVKSLYAFKEIYKDVDSGIGEIIILTEHAVLSPPNRKYPYIYNIDSLKRLLQENQ